MLNLPGSAEVVADFPLEGGFEQSVALSATLTSRGSNARLIDDARRRLNAIIRRPFCELGQPTRVKYWASSADISIVPSRPTLICRPERVWTEPRPEGASKRTRKR